MTPKEKAFATLAKTMIDNLKKRGMDGHYFDDCASLVSYLKETLPDDSVIAWGGSMSIGESGVMDMLKAGNYRLIDRAEAKTPEESRELYSRAVLSDYFFMSTNAITIPRRIRLRLENGKQYAFLIPYSGFLGGWGGWLSL